MNKVVLSAIIDFMITGGTAFLALPTSVELELRTVLVILVGALVSTAKGLKTYSAEHPRNHGGKGK